MKVGDTITLNGQHYVRIHAGTTVAGRTAKEWLDVEIERQQAIDERDAAIAARDEWERIAVRTSVECANALRHMRTARGEKA